MFFKFHLQVVLNDLINSLKLTIGLRMINQTEVFLYAELVTEFPEFLAVELCSIIRHDLMRYIESAYYCLPHEALNLLAGDHGQWFGLCPLRKIVDRNHSVFECRSRCRQGTDEIYPPYCENPW